MTNRPSDSHLIAKMQRDILLIILSPVIMFGVVGLTAAICSILMP